MADSPNMRQNSAAEKGMTASRVQPLSDHPDFMTYQMQWATALLKPLGYFYMRLHNLVGACGKPGALIVHKYFFLFLLSIIGIVVCSPRYLVVGYYLFEKFLLGTDGVKLDTSFVPYSPNNLLLILGLFLLTYHFRQKIRILCLLFASLLLLYVEYALLTVGIAAVFFIAGYFIIKLPIRRSYAVILICTLSVLLLAICTQFTTGHLSGINIIFVPIVSIPMLWYSVYQELPPKRRLNIRQFLTYHYTRAFGSPVITYPDILSPPDNLLKIQYAGIKAFYVVVLAVSFMWAADKIDDAIDQSQLTGINLLLFSYIIYVSRACVFIITINTFIGALRLFGIPVRDNFNYWMLARTPNEHWRRWNLLFREWVITFVFFPIMRAKRWLFVAVMASLLTSGVLHIIPRLFDDRVSPFHIGNILFYWAINGIAIYVVIKTPMLFPKAVDRLKLKTSFTWSFIGIILTSAFYSVLIFMRTQCHNWADVTDYFQRLVSL